MKWWFIAWSAKRDEMSPMWWDGKRDYRFDEYNYRDKKKVAALLIFPTKEEAEAFLPQLNPQSGVYSIEEFEI